MTAGLKLKEVTSFLTFSQEKDSKDAIPTTRSAMDTITLTKTDKGVVVGGTTYDVKEVLRAAGARWTPAGGAWIFHGEEVATIADTIRSAVEDCVAAAVEVKEVAKRQKAWLKTEEGRAATAAAEKKRVAATFASVGGHWLCCADCSVVDWARKHVSCKEHGFFVRGGLYTGD